jgi:low affinity Fe/Cu permease
MDDWVEDIVENTHYRDIQSLRQKLDEAIQSHYDGMTQLTVTKKCD